jgi:hypothetical protein
MILGKYGRKVLGEERRRRNQNYSFFRPDQNGLRMIVHELDIDSLADFEKELTEYLDGYSGGRLLLDMSNVRWLSSAFPGVIAAANKKTDVPLKITGLKEGSEPFYIFRMCKLESMIYQPV